MSGLSVHCSLLTVPDGGASARLSPSSPLKKSSQPGHLSQRLRRIAEAGFDGVQTVPPGTAALPRFAAALKESGLTSLNAQVDGYWRDDDWQDARVVELLDLSRRYDLPFFLEVHRHRLTQDIRRTLALVERHPALALCGDFSHYAVMSELRAPWPDEWREALHTLARRCGEVHARLNDGQRVQDPLPLVGAPQREEFFELWRSARRSWPGPRFLITTELLPATVGYDTRASTGRRAGHW